MILLQDVAGRLFHADMPNIEDFSRLTDVAWRQSYEAEHGLFVAEGRLVIERAVTAGLKPRMILTNKKFEAPLRSVVPSAPFSVLSDEEIELITGYHVHRGALAAFDRPQPLTLDALDSHPGTVLVLDGLVDHENVGTLIRSAAGLGIAAVVLSHECADPLYRRSIKTSMGAVFTLPWIRAGRSRELFLALRDRGFEQWAFSPSGEVLLTLDHSRPEHLAMWVGNEANGVNPGLLASFERRMSIPMARDTDSLNVAAAGAIAMWAVQNMRVAGKESTS